MKKGYLRWKVDILESFVVAIAFTLGITKELVIKSRLRKIDLQLIHSLRRSEEEVSQTIRSNKRNTIGGITRNTSCVEW